MRSLYGLAGAVLLGYLLGQVGWQDVAKASPPTHPSPPDLAAMVEGVQGAVVHVASYLSRPRDLPAVGDRSPSDEAMGSGYVASSDGYVVTSAHVVSGGAAIYVHLLGRGWLPARVVGADPVIDIAVLKVEASGLPILSPADFRSVKVGNSVVAVGSPFRLMRSFTAGVVSGLGRSDVGTPSPFEDFVQHDAAVNVGSSGGPLVDVLGRVVGINTAILSRTVGHQGISFAVPIDVVLPSFESIRSTGRPPRRASLGASVRDLSAREAISVPGGVGQVVTRLSEDSAARRGGLAEGDVVVALGGVPATSRGALLRALWARGAGGGVVTLDVWRKGQSIRLSITPTER